MKAIIPAPLLFSLRCTFERFNLYLLLVLLLVLFPETQRNSVCGDNLLCHHHHCHHHHHFYCFMFSCFSDMLSAPHKILVLKILLYCIPVEGYQHHLWFLFCSSLQPNLMPVSLQAFQSIHQARRWMPN